MTDQRTKAFSPFQPKKFYLYLNNVYGHYLHLLDNHDNEINIKLCKNIYEIIIPVNSIDKNTQVFVEWAFTGDTEVCGRELGQFGRSRTPLAISLLWHTSSLDDTCNNAVSPLHKPNTTGSDNVVAYAVLAARDVSSAQRSVGTGSSQTRSSRVRPSSELQGESFRDPDITAWRGEKKENKRKERWSKVLFLVASCVSAC